MISLERFVRFVMDGGFWLSMGEQGIRHWRQGVGGVFGIGGIGKIGGVGRI